MTITDIVTNIDRRLAEVHAELTHLQGACAALVNGTQPAAAPKSRRAHRKPRTAYEVVPVGKLTTLVSSSEGMRTRQSSEVTNGDPA